MHRSLEYRCPWACLYRVLHSHRIGVFERDTPALEHAHEPYAGRGVLVKDAAPEALQAIAPG
jgi:hypothetical protein